jgi:hypothetical protein
MPDQLIRVHLFGIFLLDIITDFVVLDIYKMIIYESCLLD